MGKSNYIKLLEEIVGKDNIKLNEKMANHTSFKVGGGADIFITVKTPEQIIDILKLELDLPITIIGNGSNLLVKDNGIRGVVLKYIASEYKINGNEVIVDAGVVNGHLAHVLLNNGLSGFEFASGIPGTIGGAIYMNAGAYGKEISDIIKDVTYIDLDNAEIHTIKNEECGFKYRESIFMKMNTIILEATIALSKESNEDIKERMEEYRDKRTTTQPIEYPNAGSTFKRGEDFVTAKLIDDAGLKGYKIGGAEVSTKHAGFIVNSGNATADDILKLIDYVQEKIYEKYKKKLKLEVRVIGE